MGVDIDGCNPRSETGEYIHFNWVSWHPIVLYIEDVAPDIAAKCRHWQSNDGDGLKAGDAEAIAARLQAEIDSGRTEHYARIYTSKMESLPDEPCRLCEGTGRRKPVPHAGAGDLATGIDCNGCGTTGYVRAQWASYPFCIDSLKDFIAFLRDCGGFRIH
jgi:hypothetical protein